MRLAAAWLRLAWQRRHTGSAARYLVLIGPLLAPQEAPPRWPGLPPATAWAFPYTGIGACSSGCAARRAKGQPWATGDRAPAPRLAAEPHPEAAGSQVVLDRRGRWSCSP